MTSWFSKKTASAPVQVDAETIERKIKDFIASKSKLVQASDITRDMKIFSSGVLDSLMFIELVLFVEKHFQVKLTKTKAGNMNSIDTVEQIIEAVLSAAGESG